MKPLKVRKIDFRFDHSMPYQAFPETPHWGNFVNVITLIAPAFERYFIKAIRSGMPRITDPQLRATADCFCAQEAQHSRHHIAHQKVLLGHYPQLAETDRQIRASYDALFKHQSEAFHLSYAATVELTFGPIAQFVIANRQQLFKGAQQEIASFILWHLVEEFEHRSAALDVYDHVIGSYTYRMKTAPAVLNHVYAMYQLSLQGLQQHVYGGDKALMPLPHHAFGPVPLRSRAAFLYQLCCTLLPNHDPQRLRQPEWVSQWLAAEQAGVDMRYYSA